MPHGILWKDALVALPDGIENSAADWEHCAIGERFAFDRETRGRIMSAWGKFVGNGGTDNGDEVSLLIRRSKDPASEAMRMAHGNRILALAILGGTFPDAVIAAVESDDGNSDKDDALRILAAIDALATDLPALEA